MIDIKEEYRKTLHCIGRNDKIIPYRSLDDMRWGTLTIERYEGHTMVLGENKNNGGNLIRFAKIVSAEQRLQNALITGLYMISVPLVINYIFGLIVMYKSF